jgi:hypothetical protein
MTDVKRRPVSRKSDKRTVKRVTGDLAELVRDKTLADVKAGKLKPTLQHGLMAQQMIDKREERAADRQLAIRLAAMLGGRVPPAGVIIDVTPEQRLLAAQAEEGEEFDPTDLDSLA